MKLMSRFLFACCIFLNHILMASDYCIVFVHIGNTLPVQMDYALSQARTFNPDCPIYLIANEVALETFSIKDPTANITTVTCESLNKTDEHLQFLRDTRLSFDFHGLWRYSCERFLYLNDLMKERGLENVFHLENDVLLYVNLEELLPIFQSQYNGIAATFDNDQRCIPSFVYIPNQEKMSLLADCFGTWASLSYLDMHMLPFFRDLYGSDAIDNLPIITKEYVNDRPLVSPAGHVAKNPDNYCNNVDLFASIFDAAAIGQYFDGGDRRYFSVGAGCINGDCIFNASILSYEWELDDQGRRVPYAIYAGRKFRINNLHIHSKRLELFLSRDWND